MKKMILTLIINLFLFNAQAHARDYLHIVGSNSVYQFATIAAEDFAEEVKIKKPVVESTGSGGGINLFCQGTGIRYPDIVGSSRPMTNEEKTKCKVNLVDDILEIKFGYDGVAIVSSFNNPINDLQSIQLFLAVIEKTPTKDNHLLEANNYNRWSDIHPMLPNQFIQFYGPSTSSGTREYFEQDFLLKTCDSINTYYNQANAKEDLYKALCTSIRNDGRYIEVGDNYNLIVQKLQISSDSLGLIPYSYYIQNQFNLKLISLEGVSPTLANIYSDKYKLVRPLYLYVKRKHFSLVPHLQEFINYFNSDKLIGIGGKLESFGLVPIKKS